MDFRKLAKDLFYKLNLNRPMNITKRGDHYIGISRDLKVREDADNNTFYQYVFDTLEDLIPTDGKNHTAFSNRYLSDIKYGKFTVYDAYDAYNDHDQLRIRVGYNPDDKQMNANINIIEVGYAVGPDGEDYRVSCTLNVKGKMDSNRRITFRCDLWVDIDTFDN